MVCRRDACSGESLPGTSASEYVALVLRDDMTNQPGQRKRSKQAQRHMHSAIRYGASAAPEVLFRTPLVLRRECDGESFRKARFGHKYARSCKSPSKRT